MFSYLRSHHKRTGSNPTSPDTPFSNPNVASDSGPLPSPGFYQQQQQHSWQHEEQALYEEWPEPEPISFTPVSPLPPVLPPIPRVASVRKAGARSPTKRESFGINFDRTSLNLERRSLEHRQDSAIVKEEESAPEQKTWSYGQSAQPLVASETSSRQWTSGSDTLSVETMHNQPSKRSMNSQASSGKSTKYDGHSSFMAGAPGQEHRLDGHIPIAAAPPPQELKLDGRISMAGAPLRQEHRLYDEQQARMFRRMERSPPTTNRRPHTAAPTGVQRQPQAQARAQFSPFPHHGLQPPRPGIAEPLSAHIEQAPSMPLSAGHTSFNRVTPVSPQPTMPTMSPGFLSVAYDTARSRTPPGKGDAPGRPASPQPLPNVKSRPKLNLRNPMSLLLRRRSGHNLDTLQLPNEGLLLSINSKSELPEDYDPRIKGTKVHDFNAPRPPPTRVYTSPPGQGRGSGAAQSGKNKEERSDSPRHKRTHTPTAFVEHFDDDDVPAKGQGVRAEELVNKDFVKRNSREMLSSDLTLPLPPFARKISGTPLDEKDPADGPSPGHIEEEDNVPLAMLPIITPPPPEAASQTPPPIDAGSIMPTPEDKMRIVQTHSPSGMPPQLSPRKPRNRKSLGLPKHLDSRSSRFSFQLGGPEAQLQEKLLEERHKAKQAEKAMQAKMTEEEDEYDEDDYDNGYDDADMYGEEEIPGMEDEDPMDGPLSSFSLGSRNMSMTGYDDGFGPPETFATASQLPSSAEPLTLEDQNPLGVSDVVAAARMALSSNPPSPATYSPNSIDSRSLRLPSNASAKPGMERGRTSHEGSFKARFESSHSGSHSRTREVLPATQEHPEGMSAQICEEDNEDGPYDTTATVAGALDDDMYFDDGMIEDPGDEEDVVHFNEDAFDDPASQLYERKAVNEPIPGQQNFMTAATIHANGEVASQRVSVEQANENKRVTSLDSNARPISMASPQQYRSSMRKSHLSDFTNLEAYHSALANAATQAAAEGRFQRKASQAGKASDGDHDTHPTRYSDSSMDSEPPLHRQYTLESSGQSLVQDDQRVSNSSSFPSVGQRSSGESAKLEGFPITNGAFPPTGLGGHARMSSGLGFDPSTFSFDDQSGLDSYEDDDDQIIAAANAEALANDEEGEYGREFGFYAAPPPMASMIQTHLRGGDASSASGSEDGSEVEFANGGYFGPKGMNTIERSKSLREPNLTPITERSEYSTRNSCISLFGLHSSGGPGATGLTPVSAGPLPSPGLAQLARMSPYPSEHDEMSMENLMKLRRAHFGDGRGSFSDLSNAGSSSPRNSSPVMQAGSFLQPRHSHLSHSSHAAAVGWLNGVGMSVPYGSVEGLERLGEDDESSSDEDDDNGVTDGEVNASSDGGYDEDDMSDDRLYHDGNSPMPESPTITAADSSNMSSSPTPPDGTNMYQQRNQAFQNLTLINTSPSPPSPPPQPVIFEPSTPRSALLSSSPTNQHTPKTAHRITKPPHPSSSPSPMPKPQQKAPYSPGHSRNSSRNEDGVSVAYVMETDEGDGSQRWVLERRRTSQLGETVVVGREVVTGGRI